MNNTTKLIIALVVGLILGYLIGVATNGDDTEMRTEMDADTEMTEGEEMMEDEEGDVMGDSTEENVVAVPGTNNVSVIDQPAGSMVSVSNISLSQDSWVTVVENPNTNPWILGAQWLPAGNHVGSSIELLRDTVSGNSYSVMIRQDNGDRNFSKEDDVLVGDGSGNPIAAPFMAL